MGKRKQYQFAGIYQFFNLQNGKRYIGQAQNISNRLYEHKRRRNLHGTNIAFYNAVNKYGWEAFEFSVIEKVDDLEKLNEREQFWIDTFQSFKKETGYNICREANTTRGYKYSEKTRKRLSEWAKSRVGEKNTFYGKIHSEESKRKIGQANAKWERSEEYKQKLRKARANNTVRNRKIKQINPSTLEVLREWQTIKEAAKFVVCSPTSISNVLSGRNKICKGYKWEYAD